MYCVLFHVSRRLYSGVSPLGSLRLHNTPGGACGSSSPASLGLVELHAAHILCTEFAPSSLCRSCRRGRRRSRRSRRGHRSGGRRRHRRGRRRGHLLLAANCLPLLGKNLPNLLLQCAKRTTYLLPEKTKKPLYFFYNRSHSILGR